MSVYYSLYSTLLYGFYIVSNIYSLKYFNSYVYLIGSSLMYFTIQIEINNLSKKNKKLYIIRGFPGCGKTKFIENHFKNQIITLFENYDLKNNEYENLYLEKEKKFITLFKSMKHNKNYKHIILSGFFPNKNSITNIKYLCNVFDYRLIIVSFDNVNDKNETKYLFNRSSIKFNKSYIFKNIDNYDDTLANTDDDEDYNEIFMENFNDCPGDSIPYPEKTLEQLDIELDEITKKSD
jgi:hypothetical protein